MTTLLHRSLQLVRDGKLLGRREALAILRAAVAWWEERTEEGGFVISYYCRECTDGDVPGRTECRECWYHAAKKMLKSEAAQ